MTPGKLSRLSLWPPPPGELEPYPPIPLADVWRLVNNAPAWSASRRDPVTAYVCSCFAELAYLNLTDREIDAEGRYKLIPSQVHQRLSAAGRSFDLQATGGLDFPSFVFETERYLYAGFRLREVALVAVRGTRPTIPADWKIDLDAGWEANPPWPERLHKGFLVEARRAAPQIAGRLQAFGATKVRFTGHSLGGAVASILHRNWRGLASLGAYAFGAPRLGDVASVTRAPPFGYRRPWDLVPHLPPLWLGYRDADAKAAVLLDNPGDPVPTLKEVRRDWRWKPGGKAFASQHDIEGYRARLGRAVGSIFPDLVYWEYAKQKIREKAA